jgi:aminoglycoside phosphotransferase (APT) family kinase protein
MELPEDEGLIEVLHSFGIGPDALLGRGGEARVYALDEARVLRVLHAQHGAHEPVARYDLIAELARGPWPFDVPELLDMGSVHGRQFTVERRLTGRTVAEELHRLDRADRSRLVEAYLDAAASIGDLHLEQREYFGDLLGDKPVRCAEWRDWLVEKVSVNLARARGFDSVDPVALADALPVTTDGVFVHLDAFAENMMASGSAITAVFDMGTTSIVGDRRLDPLAAAVYLSDDRITPAADATDREVSRSWLANVGLGEWYEPAERWLAGYWSAATGYGELNDWCRDVLRVH